MAQYRVLAAQTNPEYRPNQVPLSENRRAQNRQGTSVGRYQRRCGECRDCPWVFACITLSANPPGMEAIRYPVRNHDSCDRVSAEILCINDDALALINVFILNEANNITVVFL